MLVDHSRMFRSRKLDHKAYRDAHSRCIIMHDFLFSYVEYEGVWEVNRVLNPDFKPISRNTAKSIFNHKSSFSTPNWHVFYIWR